MTDLLIGLAVTIGLVIGCLVTVAACMRHLFGTDWPERTGHRRPL